MSAIRKKELEQLGRTVRRRRKKLGLSQGALSRSTDGEVSRATVANIEECVYVPTLSNLIAISDALSMDLAELLEPILYRFTGGKSEWVQNQQQATLAQ